MAQEQNIEAARARIQRLVDEIAALSKKEMRSEEFFEQYLARVAQACDAKGAAVWLVSKSQTEGKSEFQLAAQIEFESSLFQSDEIQRANLLRILTEVVETKRPVVFASSQSQSEPGSLRSQLEQIRGTPVEPGHNRTPYPFVQVPLFLKEQVLGIAQVWLQPYVGAQNLAEFSTFLTSLAAYVEQHLQARRLGNLVLETQRLQHLLRFSSDLVGALDPLEVARLAANYGRDLVGCERCSLLTVHGDRWKVLAISGQEIVEKKSSMVKAMAAFVRAHASGEMVTLSKKDLLARAEALQQSNGEEESATALALPATDQIDLAYFDLSHVVSAVLAPLLNAKKELIGVFFAESTSESFFQSAPGNSEVPAPTRISEWLSSHTSRSLQAAEDYSSLPFLPATRRFRNARLLLTGNKKRRFWIKSTLVATLIFLLCFYPKLDRVDGNCVLSPMLRNAVVPEIPGRVEKIFVREGDTVKKGTPIAQLDTKRVETELATNEQERQRLQADAERYRALGDEGSAQVALLQARVTDQNAVKLRADMEAATLRSPIEGVVVTKDIELHAGEFIQPGTTFAEVASLTHWELQVDVDEKQIGRVEEVLHRAGADAAKPVHFILYSQSARRLDASLTSAQQISSAVYARETRNVFIITFPNIDIPADIRSAMRPGLTGRAKIDLERRPLLWLSLQKIWAWVQMRMIG